MSSSTPPSSLRRSLSHLVNTTIAHFQHLSPDTSSLYTTSSFSPSSHSFSRLCFSARVLNLTFPSLPPPPALLQTRLPSRKRMHSHPRSKRRRRRTQILPCQLRKHGASLPLSRLNSLVSRAGSKSQTVKLAPLPSLPPLPLLSLLHPPFPLIPCSSTPASNTPTASSPTHPSIPPSSPPYGPSSTTEL